MKSVFGLLVACAALFLIWLWATGRFDAVFAAIKDGNAPPPGFQTDPGNAGAGSGGSWTAISNILKQTSYVQSTPPYVNIPSYVPNPLSQSATG